MSTPGWHPDPHQRHEFRFWDGQTWTTQVLTGGKTFTDDVANLYTPGPEVPAPTMPQGFWPEPAAARIQQYGHAGGPAQPLPSQHTYHHQTVYVQAKKSVAVAFILAFLFGPLGMFYSTVPGALVMLLVSTFLAIFTLGLSLFITWPICIVWGMAACSQ